MRSRELTRGQRARLRRILRFYRDAEAYNGVTSVRFKLDPITGSGGMVSVTVRTRRSDCGRNSVRALLCERYAHFILGPRGGLSVGWARHGFDSNSNETRHVASMLRAGRILS